MKAFNNFLKVMATIAAIIGIVYVVATYGDRIVAWANNMLNRFFDKRTCFFDIDEQMAPAEEPAEETCPCTGEAACEA